MSDVGTKGFYGKDLPPFLQKFQRLNDEYNESVKPKKPICYTLLNKITQYLWKLQRKMQ